MMERDPGEDEALAISPNMACMIVTIVRLMTTSTPVDGSFPRSDVRCSS